MKHIFYLTVLLGLPSLAWGDDYLIQSQIAADEADMQSQHEEINRQQQQIHDEMAAMREQMVEQRLQNVIDNANTRDEANYH